MFVLVFVMGLIRTSCAEGVVDPEAYMTAVRLSPFHHYRSVLQIEMIRYWGYPAESHDVTTADGYILEMFRIPYGRLSERSRSLIFHSQINFPYPRCILQSSGCFVRARLRRWIHGISPESTSIVSRYLTLRL